MAEQDGEQKVTVGRGPSYPYIDLGKAVDRIADVAAKGAERTKLTPESYYKFWGYKPRSSGARQTMAALNAYGLVDYTGKGNDRRVQLTERGRRIVLDRRPDSSEKKAALREAALEPNAFSDLWDQFGRFLPDRDVMISWLTIERSFNQQGAEAAVTNFVTTVEYAELDKPENLSKKDDSQVGGDMLKDEPARVGDLVEYEINGQLMSEDPVRVRAVSDDGAWVFVEHEETGIAMNDTTVIERAQGASAGAPPRMPLSPVVEPKAEGPLDIIFDMHSLAVAGKTSDLDAVDRLIEDLQELRPILAKRWKKKDDVTD